MGHDNRELLSGGDSWGMTIVNCYLVETVGYLHDNRELLSGEDSWGMTIVNCYLVKTVGP